MNWRQADQHHWARDCGRYTAVVFPSLYPERAGQFDYLPFRRGTPPVCLADAPLHTLDAAIRCCTDDLKQLQRDAATTTKG